MTDKKPIEQKEVLKYSIDEIVHDEIAFQDFLRILDSIGMPQEINLDNLTSAEKELFFKDTLYRLYEENIALADKCDEIQKNFEVLENHFYQFQNEIRTVFKEMVQKEERVIEKNTLNFGKEDDDGIVIMLDPKALKKNPAYKHIKGFAFPMATNIGGKWTKN